MPKLSHITLGARYELNGLVEEHPHAPNGPIITSPLTSFYSNHTHYVLGKGPRQGAIVINLHSLRHLEETNHKPALVAVGQVWGHPNYADGAIITTSPLNELETGSGTHYTPV